MTLSTPSPMRPAPSGKRRVLVIGSGPIQIGQACEFDYSGTQACLAFRDEGLEVVLVNDNPASILTDAETADVVYMEPLLPQTLARIALQEKVTAVAPTFGGQVALNLYMTLASEGFWDEHGIVTLGLRPETVQLTEDRSRFSALLKSLGLETIRGGFARSVEAGLTLASTLGYPVIVRASFTLGGAGGGVANNETELVTILEEGFRVSPLAELCVEESIRGWKEYELEVMRDTQGCFLVVCGVENVNPMGVHTGDSITVSPCMTLTDVEYQSLRDQARRIFDAVGLKIGGANIQFAICPHTGRTVVVEMNPRVSRSSALVSKATGYPIARIAARLAVGRSLMDLRNEITRVTSAYFEPSIDYVAVKMPLWDTHKFEGASFELGIQMKSTGEALAFGRTFRDAFLKAWRSLERGFEGWPALPEFLSRHGRPVPELSTDVIEHFLSVPTPALFPAIKSAFEKGFTLERVEVLTRISPFFLRQLHSLVELEAALGDGTQPIPVELLREARQEGFTLKDMARVTGLSDDEISKRLEKASEGSAMGGTRPTFRMVDTCAGEFEARTPFFYKTFETRCELTPSKKPSVVIPASGPNRIGQGVEFDTSCVHAVRAAQAEGYEAILVNSNPETVSTDFLVPDKLFMEPLCEEGLLDVLRAEKPHGVFLQFGGQSPLKLAEAVSKAGFRILGTPLESIRLAEDRKKFGALMAELDIPVPLWSTCTAVHEGLARGKELGFPLLVRPSFVLGGQAMEIVRNETELAGAIGRALLASTGGHPILLDRYLEGAREYDLDLLCDGKETYIPAVMEHLEEAGVHSGDSTTVIPPRRLDALAEEHMRALASRIALRLGVVGLLNIQFALLEGVLHVIEVNPRSSRSVPFVTKATGVPMASLAARLALGRSLSELKAQFPVKAAARFCVKGPVFPFHKFPGVLPVLGPQMQSIGESMSLGEEFGEALAKSFASKGAPLAAVDTLVVVAPLRALAGWKDAFDLLAPSFASGALRIVCDTLTQEDAVRAGVGAVPWIVRNDADLVREVEDKRGAFVLTPTLVGHLGTRTPLAHRLLRTALRKRVPFSNSCHSLEGLAAAFSEGHAQTSSPSRWTLVPLSHAGAIENSSASCPPLTTKQAVVSMVDATKHSDGVHP